MVGFPGLGIPEFHMNGTLFSIGNFSIHWYGVIIALGFLVAALYVCKRAPQFGYTADDLIDMLIFAVPAAIIGARLYYVVLDWDRYKSDLLSILRIWDGGIAIYGAVIFAVITCVIFCRVKRIHAGAMLDLGALGLLIGQAIGRWGNFVNVEVFGTETTVPWRMSVNGYDVHPLFLYESLWNLLGFVLLHFLSKRRKFNGQVMLMYIAWYGLGRGFLEGMRDDMYALMIGPMRASQLLGYASCVIALALLAYHLIFKSHDPEDLNAWVAKREEWKLEKARVKMSNGTEAPLTSPAASPEEATVPEDMPVDSAGEPEDTSESDSGGDPEDAAESEE